MNIAMLNEKVVFQKSTVLIDEIGNHVDEWTDYFLCHATISSESGSEKYIAGAVVDNSDIAFTIRWCKKASAINSTEYRIIFNGEIYNITSIDHMNYKKKCLKFRCKKERR